MKDVIIFLIMAIFMGVISSSNPKKKRKKEGMLGKVPSFFPEQKEEGYSDTLEEFVSGFNEKKTTPEVTKVNPPHLPKKKIKMVKEQGFINVSKKESKGTLKSLLSSSSEMKKMMVMKEILGAPLGLRDES
jgi:hypothetical protein